MMIILHLSSRDGEIIHWQNYALCDYKLGYILSCNSVVSTKLCNISSEGLKCEKLYEKINSLFLSLSLTALLIDLI